MPFSYSGAPTNAQRVLGMHAAVVALTAVLSLAAAWTYARGDSTTLALLVVGGLVVLAVASGWWLRRELRPSDVLERLLTSVAEKIDQPYDFPEVAIASPSAVGWNRIAQAARRWTALTELEQSLSSRQSTDNGASSGNLINSLPDGVAATDEEGCILVANPAFASMCSVASGKELNERPLLEACHLPEEAVAELDAAPASKRTAVEFLTGEGNAATRRLRLTRTPRYGEQGDLGGHVWSVRDVTQQRLAEDMRDKFLATATHELRTPLANICAYAESLSTMEDLDIESQKGFYNIIQSEAMRLSKLVDDLLDVSRMQAGALAVDRRETDLGRLVEEVSRKVEASMSGKSIEFECELPPKYPKIVADKSKLAAALVNLLGNASKYTPEGGRVTFRVDVGEQKLEFAVADTGIGITPEELPHVFDRFFRSDDGRVREIPGSGLGLSLTQEVARLHGGDLTVDSELDVGSIFRLTLPLEGND